MRVMVGLTRATSGTVTISGRHYVDLPNPGLEVGVLLDASAQHAGRTGREILTIAQQFMGLPAHRVEEMLEVVSLTPDRGVPTGRRLLPGHAATARHRHRPDRRPRGADPRRARQRPGPGRHPLDARPAARLRRPRRNRAALLPPAPRDRGHRRRHRDDRQRQDRLPGHQDRAAARRRHRRPRRGPRRRSQRALDELGIATTRPTTAPCAPTRTPALVGKVALEAGVALTELRAAEAPASRTCSSSSPPPPSEKEQRHDRHRRRQPSRRHGCRAPPDAPDARDAGRAPQDVRHPLRASG